VAVRRELHAMGFRFRLHRRDLPGRPDIVLHGRRAAIFVHGCFWHRHPGCSRTTTPKTHADYWLPKFAENEARDAKAMATLGADGWQVRVVWEREALEREVLRRSLREFLICSSSES